jgi:hypothetical protein
MARKVKCNKCGYVGEEKEFPKGHDFFQNPYIASCANKDCDNHQSPGDASMRMFGGERPFVYVEANTPSSDPYTETMRRANEAS